MSLRVWLPLNGNINNQGYNDSSFSIVASNTSVSDSGKIGKCYTNNSNSSGGIISSQTIDIGTEQSMFCWFKFTSLESSSSLGGGLVTQHRYTKNTGMGITIKYVNSTTGYLSVNTGTGSSRTYNTYCGTTLLQANTWYHGGFTYDGSNVLKIYVNGNCEYTGNIGQMSCPSDYLAIFSWSLQGSSGASIHADYKLNGSINDVRVYDHCLSAKEVKELSKGLMVHYPLDGCDSAVEFDTSGYNHNGAKSGTLTTTSDTARYSLSTTFATGSHIATTLEVGDYTNSYTFAWWGKYTNYSQHMMWGYQNGNKLNLYMNNGSFYWNTGDGLQNPFNISAATYGDNNWHHFAVTGNGTAAKLYIDGEFKANAKTYRAITGTNLFFNGWAKNSEYNFNGSLSDFRLYTTVLSADDIKELYEVGASISRNGAIFANEFKEVTE